MTHAADQVGKWLDHLQAHRRYSPHTLSGYRHDLARLLELAEDIPLERLSNGHIRQFVARLHRDGLGPRSLARVLASWRGFYRWWAPIEGLPDNPVMGVKAPKAPRSLPKALSVEHAQVLLERPAAKASTDPVMLRDQAMFELLYSSGLRLSELTGLDIRYVREKGYESSAWIDLGEREVTVLGKGGKRRSVPIGEAAVVALQTWLLVRAPWVAADAEPGDLHALFLGTRGHRVSPRVVQLQLKRAAQSAGLPTQVHPHVLRHSFASHVLQSAQDLRAVQEMLGHVNISTTQIYTRLDFQHLARAYDQAHPRSGRKT